MQNHFATLFQQNGSAELYKCKDEKEAYHEAKVSQKTGYHDRFKLHFAFRTSLNHHAGHIFGFSSQNLTLTFSTHLLSTPDENNIPREELPNGYNPRQKKLPRIPLSPLSPGKYFNSKFQHLKLWNSETSFEYE